MIRGQHIALALILAMSVQAKAQHPLDPLSPEEMKKASEVLTSHRLLGEGWFLQELSLKAPQKAQIMSEKLKNVRREAAAVLVNLDQNKNVECVIDLRAKKIVSQQPITSG